MKKLLKIAAAAAMSLVASSAMAYEYPIMKGTVGSATSVLPENGKYYLIRDANSARHAFRYDSGNEVCGTHVSPEEAKNLSPLHAWYVTTSTDEAGTTVYHFQNVATGKYMRNVQHGYSVYTTADSADKGTFYIISHPEGAADQFAVSSNGSENSTPHWDGNDIPYPMVGWGSAGTNSYGHTIEFYELSEENGNITGFTNEASEIPGPIFKLNSARNEGHWAFTNGTQLQHNGTIRGNFIQIPVGTDGNFKIYSLEADKYLEPMVQSSLGSFTSSESEAGIFKAVKSPYGPVGIGNSDAENNSYTWLNHFSNGIGGWWLSSGNNWDCGTMWFMVYDLTAYNKNKTAFFCDNAVDGNGFATGNNSYYRVISQAKAWLAANADHESASTVSSKIEELEKADFGKAGVDINAMLNNLDLLASFFNNGDQVIFTNRSRNNGTAKIYPSTFNNEPVVGCTPKDDSWQIAWKLIKHEGEYNQWSFLNEYTGLYIGALPTTGGTNNNGIDVRIPMVESLEEAGHYEIRPTDSNYFALVETSFSGSSPNNNAIHGANWDGAVRWSPNDQPSHFAISLIDDATAETLSNPVLAIAPYVDADHADALGYLPYSDELKSGIDALTADKHDVAAFKVVEPVHADFDNLVRKPQHGHIYQLGKADGSKYLSSRPADNGRMTMVAKSDAELAGMLFFYDEDSRLVSLESGKVIGTCAKNACNPYLVSDTTNRGTVEFFVAAPGQFFIGTGMEGDKKRFIYNNSTNLDSGTSSLTGEDVTTPNDPTDRIGYKWLVELHEGALWVPIAGTETDNATIVLPRNMRIRPEGMKLYTAEVKNNKVVLTQFGEANSVIPANVPFIAKFNNVQRGSNNLVYLETTDDTAEAPANNLLEGSIYAATNEAPIYTYNGSTFEASTPAQTTFGQAYLREVPAKHTVSTASVEGELDALVGKLFYIKNTDVSHNRGCIIYKEGNDAIWTSYKEGVAAENLDAVAAENSNYHWTLVKEGDKRYLYNPAAGKFAAAYNSETNEIADFTWHFSDYPTEIDFVFLDYNLAESIESATFNILGGQNNVHQTRPAGMMIINGSANPVPVLSGNSADDGCGFTLHLVEGAAPAEIPSVGEALAAMDAEHSAAADYVTAHTEENSSHPGHYDAEAFGAFAETLNSELTDSEERYFNLVRAHRAAQAAGSINEFEHEGVYNFIENGKRLAAKIVWENEDATRFRLEVGEFDENTDAETAVNWLCQVDEATNTVEFIHYFAVNVGAVRSDAATAANKVRARADEQTRPEAVSLTEATVPAYDGLGNITLGDKKLTSLSAPEGAETTGISELTADRADSAAEIYDLLGRRLSKPSQGLNIINGVKTLVR